MEIQPSGLCSGHQQRRRLENLAAAHSIVRRCLRFHRVSRYAPGQVAYNLGEYPKRFSVRPTEYDRCLLREFAARGVKVIHVHEEWNDSQRLLGADKFTPHDAAGLRE